MSPFVSFLYESSWAIFTRERFQLEVDRIDVAFEVAFNELPAEGTIGVGVFVNFYLSV